MAGFDLSSTFFHELERLAYIVASVHEALGVFEAVEEKANELNRSRIGMPFAYVQILAVDRIFIGFGKATSDHKDDISFRGIKKYIDEKHLIDRFSIEEYLNLRNITLQSKNNKKLLRIFQNDISEFYNDGGYLKLKTARNRMVAHQDKVVKWEDIGASFHDVERFISTGSALIDACYFGFFNVSNSARSLTSISREPADRTIRSYHKLIDMTLARGEGIE